MSAQRIVTMDYRQPGDGVPIMAYHTSDDAYFLCEGCADARQEVLDACGAILRPASDRDSELERRQRVLNALVAQQAHEDTHSAKSQPHEAMPSAKSAAASKRRSG